MDIRKIEKTIDRFRRQTGVGCALIVSGAAMMVIVNDIECGPIECHRSDDKWSVAASDVMTDDDDDDDSGTGKKKRKKKAPKKAAPEAKSAMKLVSMLNESD